VTFNNLETNETAAVNGGYGIYVFGGTNVTVQNCTAINGGKHNVAVIDSSAVISGTTASGVMPDQPGGGGGASAFVSYSDSRFTGNTSVYNNDTVTNYPGELGFYDHADNAAALTSVVINNMTSSSPVVVGLAGSDTASVTGGTFTNTQLSGYSNTVINGVTVTGVEGAVSLGGNSTLENSIISGAAPNWEAAHDGAVDVSGEGNVIRFNTIVLNSMAGTLAPAIGIENSGSNTQIYGNIISTPYAAYFLRMTGDPGILASNNLYAGTATPEIVYLNNASPNMPVTQMPAGENVNAIYANPQFANAAEGNFGLLTGSPALGAFIPTAGEAVATDINGNPRPPAGTPTDLGAIEGYPIWISSGSGSWSSSGNWSNGIPTNAGDIANFDPFISAPSTVSLDGNWAVGALNFNSHDSYTIAAGSGGTLTLDNNGSPALVNDLFGSHAISAPMLLGSNAVISVWQPGDVLTLSGNIRGAGGISLGSASGTENMGTVVLTGSNTYAGATNVTGGTLVVGATGALPDGNVTISGGTLRLASGTGLERLTSLTINGGAMDMGNARLILSYSGISPVSTIAGYLASGYDGGTWDGSGINTSLASSYYGVGYADGADGVVAGLSSGQIEVTYAIYGDANLDGVVNGQDFTILVGNLGKTVAGWDRGDFNYDNSVDGTDFTLLVQNLGKSINGANAVLPAGDYAALTAFAAANGLMADVPEPDCAVMALGATIGFLRRRRRRPLTGPFRQA
jgi:autotransporter-associated beta strand protein